MSNFPVIFSSTPSLFNVENSNISIEYDSNHEQCYFSISISDQGSLTKYYINFTKDIPENTFVFDYFNTSELFINIPFPYVISSVMSTFYTLHKKYLASPSRLSTLPTSLNYKPYTFATSVLSPTNSQSFAWSFVLESFFHLSYDPNHSYYKSSNKSTCSSVCSFYSIKNDSLDILSPHYPFANRIKDYHFCSHKDLNINGSINSCTFATMNIPQTTCVKYLSKKNILLTTQISTENTSQSFNISLNHSHSIDGSHIFSIFNEQNSQDISVLIYPKDVQHDYNTLVEEVTKIYKEYISCYDPSLLVTLDNPIQKNEIEKRSFIQSLIEV